MIEGPPIPMTLAWSGYYYDRGQVGLSVLVESSVEHVASCEGPPAGLQHLVDCGASILSRPMASASLLGGGCSPGWIFSWAMASVIVGGCSSRRVLSWDKNSLIERGSFFGLRDFLMFLFLDCSIYLLIDEGGTLAKMVKGRNGEGGRTCLSGGVG